MHIAHGIGARAVLIVLAPLAEAMARAGGPGRRPPPPQPRRRRGTRTDEEGVRFEGWFNAAGELDGRGTMHFPDGSWQSCQWTDGVPHGPGEYVGDDLSIIKGTWVEGDLQGHVQEVTCGGLVIYDGLYQDSRRHGLGILRFQDGSRVEGEFAHGTLEGHAKFFYPDGVSGFEGRWVDGDMQEARYFGPLPDEPPLPWTGEQGKTGWREVVFTADETTETEMGNHLLLRDPYESRRCRVGRSSLCGTPREGLAGDNSAGEGLFAKCEIAPGELVAYYNGVRVPHSKVNKRPWRLNDNCISLDADCAIDVPLDFASTDTYRATVGHKANHSFEPNAKYVQVFHPRFGHIKGIRAVRAIRPREEVLVDYGYTSQMPKWYREILVSQKHERRPAGKRGRESSQASSKRAKKQN